MNRKAYVREISDIFKAVVTGIIGIIFLSAIIPIMSPAISTDFANLGIFLIIVSVIAGIISAMSRPLRR